MISFLLLRITKLHAENRTDRVLFGVFLIGLYMLLTSIIKSVTASSSLLVTGKLTMLLGISYLLSSETWQLRFTIVTLGLLISISIQSIVTNILALLIPNTKTLYARYHYMELSFGWGLAHIILYTVLFSCAIWSSRHTLSRMRETEGRFSLILWSSLGGCYFISFLVDLLKAGRSPLDESITLLIWFVMLIFCWIIIAAGYRNSIDAFAQHERSMMQRFNHELRKSYDLIAEKNDNLLIQSHDFKNHLRTLQNMQGVEQTAYIASLLKEYASSEPQFHSGNRYVDAVINSKYPEMLQNEIHFSYNSRMPKTVQIPATDLCAIVANQLDNAIEACIKIPKPEERWIQYTTDKSGDMFILICENSIVYGSVPSNTPLLTTKNNAKHLHGLGLKSIEISAERCGGALFYETLDDRFISKVVLQENEVPVKENLRS
ncbi:MAG: GHKL domain-containing protein [Clostridiales bacterium]|nr:GHKL domain-containing protein [Clostridiales bacterium]